jgi:hypothetical protein
MIGSSFFLLSPSHLLIDKPLKKLNQRHPVALPTPLFPHRQDGPIPTAPGLKLDDQGTRQGMRTNLTP